MKKHLYGLVFIVLNTFYNIGVKAQQNPLFINDLYSGISAVGLSPSHSFINPNSWDVQVFSEDLSMTNDQLYISQQRWLGLGRATIDNANPEQGISGTQQANVLDYFNKNLTSIFISSDVLGPSFSVKLKAGEKTFNAGLFTRFRAQTSIVDLDNYFRFNNQTMVAPSAYYLRPINTSFMNWGELGLNLSTSISEDNNWYIGANFKYIAGFDAYNIQNVENLVLHNDPDDTNKNNVSAQHYNVIASYVTNYDFEGQQYVLKQNGRGAGVDFGISYIVQSDDKETYDFLLSFNILDVGYVHYNGAKHSFVGNRLVDLTNNPAFKNKKFVSPDVFLNDLSTEVYGNPNTSLVSKGFNIGLPTALHLQMSKKVAEHQFINLNWIQRATVFDNSLKRNNHLMVSYFFQKALFSYGISGSLVHYKEAMLGAFFRIGPLIFGSDNIVPLFFKQKQLHAANVFIGLKIYPFWDSEYKKHRREKCKCEE